MSNEFFRDAQWLDAHGGLVEPHTAEEYFSGSQWYDRTCLNEQWKVQGVQPTEEVRSRSTGVEYRLVHLQPPVLYVLRKERRESGLDARTLASYYILDGTIFQAPTVEHVITSRMAKCVFHFKAAMALLQQHAVCDAQYDFVSQWDYRRDALADRRQESVADSSISFGEPTKVQQRVPERNVANQLSAELRAAFPLPAESANSTADAGGSTGIGNAAKRPSTDGEMDNRLKKART